MRIFSSIALLLLSAHVIAASAKSGVSFPPYPERWEFEIPQSERPIDNLQVRGLPNGDVLVTYRACCGDERTRNRTFFSDDSYPSVESAFGGKFPPAGAASEFRTNSGKTIRTAGTQSGLFRGCYDGLEATVSMFEKAPSGSPDHSVPSVQKTVLYVLENPARRKSPEHCNESRSFRAATESLGGALLPLADGTFLLIDVVHGVVIRMTDTLQTSSKMLGQRVFILDTATFRNRFGAQYGDRASGGRNLERLHRDLQRWLTQLSKGAQK